MPSWRIRNKNEKKIALAIHEPRAIPVAIYDQVKYEINNLVRCGIISSVQLHGSTV